METAYFILLLITNRQINKFANLLISFDLLIFQHLLSSFR